MSSFVWSVGWNVGWALTVYTGIAQLCHMVDACCDANGVFGGVHHVVGFATCCGVL